jgi:hypothetical protein
VQLRTKTIFVTALLAIGWIAAVVWGLKAVMTYEGTPGRIGTVPLGWPGSRIHRATDRITLVMLAHPRCPCTRASLGELAQIMARTQGKVRAYVLFLKPGESGVDWADTELWRKAAAIPGVTALADVDGAEARRFGVETSGHTLLFGSDGRLLFNGGVTQSRGHSGDNAGEDAIVALVNNHVAGLSRTLVFGCSLFNQTKTETVASLKCKKT